MIIMPRAARPDLVGANWPLVADGKGGYYKQYNRAYRFAPIIKANHAEHIQTLIEIVCKIRSENQSAILSFNTIQECETFNRILQASEGHGQVQIFDDTCSNEENNDGLKISQKTAILHAAQPGMITLTTAAGSRGADFNSVSVGILAKPGLSRVNDQKAGRIGRNEDFGIVYEVYCYEDLNEAAQVLLTKNELVLEEKSQPIKAQAEKVYNRPNLRLGLDKMEDALQQADLAQLEARKPLDEFKDKVQREYQTIKSKGDQWGTFFASIKADRPLTKLQHTWSAMQQRGRVDYV